MKLTVLSAALATIVVVGSGCAGDPFDEDAFDDTGIPDGVTTDGIFDAIDVAGDAGDDATLPPLLRTSPGSAYHEHALSSELEEGVALNQDDTVLLWLEHPTDTPLLHDTGLEAGHDRLAFRYFYEHEHAFCWNEPPEDAPHTMTLTDSDGNEVLNLTEGQGCKKVTLQAGDYFKHFSHGGDGDEGELIFIQPDPAESETPAEAFQRLGGASVDRSGSIACKPVAQLTHSTIGQLLEGQVAVTNTCYPASDTQVWVYDQDCPNILDGTNAPQIQVLSVYTGPNTEAIIHRGPWYTGYSTVARNTGSTPVCLTSTRFRDDYWTAEKYSMKVWVNNPASPATSCMVKWVGRNDEFSGVAPAAGEVWLFGAPGTPRDEKNPAAPGLQMVYVLDGPCFDLCRINASETISYARIGPNTVMTTYLDPKYLGQSFPYQGDVSTFGADNLKIESVYVESLAQYNQETTLLRTKNCNQCNLIGLRLVEGENLSGAQLVDANLTGARMMGVDLSNSNATRAIFRGANLAYSSLKGAILSNAVFEGDDHTGAANLSYAYMPNAVLDHAHMNGVTADYAQIYGAQATVLQATMVGIHLANSILCNMNFSQVAMKDATLTGANLISANFLGADLRNANLVNASIQGTVFDGAYLYGAQMQNSTVAFNPGLLTVTRLGDNNTLQTVSVSFNATSLPADTTNADTYCPDGGQSDDGNSWCDSVDELTAHSPPSPPTCIPSATQFCPRPGR